MPRVIYTAVPVEDGLQNTGGDCRWATLARKTILSAMFRPLLCISRLFPLHDAKRTSELHRANVVGLMSLREYENVASTGH